MIFRVDRANVIEFGTVMLGSGILAQGKVLQRNDGGRTTLQIGDEMVTGRGLPCKARVSPCKKQAHRAPLNLHTEK